MSFAMPEAGKLPGTSSQHGARPACRGAAAMLQRHKCRGVAAGAGPLARQTGRWQVTWHTHRSRRQLLRNACMLAGERAAAAIRCHSVWASHALRVLAHSIRTVACAQHGLPYWHVPAEDHTVLAARRRSCPAPLSLFEPPSVSACTPCRAPRAHRVAKDKHQHTRVRRERRV